MSDSYSFSSDASESTWKDMQDVQDENIPRKVNLKTRIKNVALKIQEKVHERTSPRKDSVREIQEVTKTTTTVFEKDGMLAVKTTERVFTPTEIGNQVPTSPSYPRPVSIVSQ